MNNLTCPKITSDTSSEAIFALLQTSFTTIAPKSAADVFAKTPLKEPAKCKIGWMYIHMVGNIGERKMTRLVFGPLGLGSKQDYSV